MANCSPFRLSDQIGRRVLDLLVQSLPRGSSRPASSPIPIVALAVPRTAKSGFVDEEATRPVCRSCSARLDRALAAYLEFVAVSREPA